MLYRKIIYSFLRQTLTITFASALFFSQPASAGAGFSEQGNALSKALYNDLLKKGICTNVRACAESLQMYREDGKRIYVNMYGQKNTILASKVAAFYIEKGLNITGGMPITLKVFTGPKTQYLGLIKGLFGNNEEILKLELNK